MERESPVLAVNDEAARRRGLRQMKVRATGLLVFAALVYVAVRLFGGGEDWAGYVEAATEGAMVGGLADWFAVTALFRHPMGIPIPHTALIPTRKDQLGRAIGGFVEARWGWRTSRVTSAPCGARQAASRARRTTISLWAFR